MMDIVGVSIEVSPDDLWTIRYHSVRDNVWPRPGLVDSTKIKSMSSVKDAIRNDFGLHPHLSKIRDFFELIGPGDTIYLNRADVVEYLSKK